MNKKEKVNRKLRSFDLREQEKRSRKICSFDLREGETHEGGMKPLHCYIPPRRNRT